MKIVKKNKIPWPTKNVMKQVYQQQLWGSNNTPFYSGDGSHDTEIIEPYIQTVINFLKKFSPFLTVCDLGCGDFNIGKEIAPFSSKYIAIDIVDELILYNQTKYQNENISFKCLDIAAEALPKTECVIIRQVLQHLCNAEIESILKKLHQFKYIILTEHLPDGEFIPTKIYISYMRYPQYINKEGYIMLDGLPSFDQDCELETYLEDELLDLTVQNLAMYTENQSAVQSATYRIQTNE